MPTTSRRCAFSFRKYRIMSHDTLHSWESETSETDVKPLRVYLAGFEVFFEPKKEAVIAAAKKRICASWGFEGVSPSDIELSLDLPSSQRAAEIYSKDVDLMKTCDAICANLTPFRGLSADAGTCWELGYFVGAGKLAVAYTNDPRTYEERMPIAMMAEAGATASPPLDRWGMVVDMQDEADNCMMTRCVAHLSIAEAELSDTGILEDLRAFEDSISRLSDILKKESGIPVGDAANNLCQRPS